MKKIFLTAALAATLFSACNNTPSASSLKTDIDTISYALGMSFSIPEDNLKQGLTQMGSDSAYVNEFRQGLKDGLKMSEDKKAMAYNVGVQQGMMISQREIKGIEAQLFAGDSTGRLNMDLFLAGLKGAAEQKGILLTDTAGNALNPQALNELIREMMQSAYAKRIEAQYGEYKQQNIDFMAKVAQEEGVKELGNGVYYKELVAGKGAKAAKGDNLELSYEGRLMDGTVFDKTEEGKTTKFPVGIGRAIAGFDAAMSNMEEGAEWEVYIPADQAYGEMESGKIKPYSALIFKIKAVRVEKAGK